MYNKLRQILKGYFIDVGDFLYYKHRRWLEKEQVVTGGDVVAGIIFFPIIGTAYLIINLMILLGRILGVPFRWVARKLNEE